MEVDIEGPRVEVHLPVLASLTTSSPTTSSMVTVTVDSVEGASVLISSCAKMNGRGGVERKRMYKFAL